MSDKDLEEEKVTPDSQESQADDKDENEEIESSKVDREPEKTVCDKQDDNAKSTKGVIEESGNSSPSGGSAVKNKTTLDKILAFVKSKKGIAIIATFIAVVLVAVIVITSLGGGKNDTTVDGSDPSLNGSTGNSQEVVAPKGSIALLVPNDGEINVSTMPSIKWENDGSEWYDIVIATDSKYSDKVFGKLCEETYTAVMSPLANETKYYLKITSQYSNVDEITFTTIKHYPHTGVVVGDVNSTDFANYDVNEWANSADSSAGTISLTQKNIDNELYKGSAMTMLGESTAGWYRMIYSPLDSSKKSWASREGLQFYFELEKSYTTTFRLQLVDTAYSQFHVEFDLNNAGQYMLNIPFSAFVLNYEGSSNVLDPASIMRVEFELRGDNLASNTAFTIGDVMAVAECDSLNTHEVSGAINVEEDFTLADFDDFVLPNIYANSGWGYSETVANDPKVAIDKTTGDSMLSFTTTQANYETQIVYTLVSPISFYSMAGIGFTLKNEAQSGTTLNIRIMAGGVEYVSTIGLNNAIDDEYQLKFGDFKSSSGAVLSDASTITSVAFGLASSASGNANILLGDIIILKEII